MMRKVFTTVLLLLFISIALFGCSSSNTSTNGDSASEGPETVKFIANTAWVENNFMAQGLIEFSNTVKEATDGKVEIEVSTGGALGLESGQLLSAVKNKLVPISEFLAFSTEGEEPLYGLGTLPFLVQNIEENKILNDIARPYYEKVAEEKWNQKILYIATWPGAGFWTKNSISTLEDLKGLKVRTADGNGARVVQQIGAVPYQLPFSDVYSALATGAIDSVLTSSPSAVDAKFWEVLDYYVPANVTMGVSFVTINLDEFNKLDNDAQEAIIQAGKEIETKMWERVKQIEAENEKLVNEEGITTIAPSDELMASLFNITEKLRNEWLEQAPAEAREIVDKFYEEIGR